MMFNISDCHRNLTSLAEWTKQFECHIFLHIYEKKKLKKPNMKYFFMGQDPNGALFPRKHLHQSFIQNLTPEDQWL